jgi:hypothetical protein
MKRFRTFAAAGRAFLTLLGELLTPEAVSRVLHAVGRALLGAFVLWQVYYLATSFFVAVEDSLRPATAERWPALEQWWPSYVKGEDRFRTDLNELNRKYLKRYGQATNQPQAWSLFAPSVWRVFSFPALELRWDDDHDPGPVETRALERVFLGAVNEPGDVDAFLRYKDFRFRKYETYFIPLPPASDGAFDPWSERWRDRIESDVREYGDNMVAYLRWRWERYEREHPGVPRPTQIILHMRGYAIPPPPGPSPWRFIDYGRHPVARWLPNDSDESGGKVLQRYDPLTDRYE